MNSEAVEGARTECVCVSVLSKGSIEMNLRLKSINFLYLFKLFYQRFLMDMIPGLKDYFKLPAEMFLYSAN